MAKANKVQEPELSIEDQLFLDSFLNSSKPKEGTRLPSLVINTDVVDKDGNRVLAPSFTIYNSNIYADKILVRPIDFYNKLVKQEKDKGTGKWRTTSETILYKFGEQPIDTGGGVACGRLMGKAIPSHWTNEQKLANKQKASLYGILYGMAEFPGEAPKLVSFRIPVSKAIEISKALNAKVIGEGNHMANFNFEFSLTPVKGSVHPALQVNPLLNKRLAIGEIIAEIRQVQNVVNEHNNRIRDLHSQSSMASFAFRNDKQLINSLEDDFNDE